MHWQVTVSSAAACFSSPNIHSVDFASFQPLRSQHNSSRLVFGALPKFWTITFSSQSIPHHPPNVNIPDQSTSHVQPTNFFVLFGRNFCEQQLVQGKPSNTAKWSTFCVNFNHVLTILGWLWCFKINYLVTSNVQFQTVSINLVTYILYISSKATAWIQELQLLSSFSTTQPHAAYTAFTHDLSESSCSLLELYLILKIFSTTWVVHEKYFFLLWQAILHGWVAWLNPASAWVAIFIHSGPYDAI